MSEELRTKEETLREVDLTTEQVERAERLYHDIWSDADAHDAAREIIFLRDERDRLQNIIDTLELGS
jgi:hypothetical protein